MKNKNSLKIKHAIVQTVLVHDKDQGVIGYGHIVIGTTGSHNVTLMDYKSDPLPEGWFTLEVLSSQPCIVAMRKQ